jgi:hypothetical protein
MTDILYDDCFCDYEFFIDDLVSSPTTCKKEIEDRVDKFIQKVQDFDMEYWEDDFEDSYHGPFPPKNKRFNFSKLTITLNDLELHKRGILKDPMKIEQIYSFLSHGVVTIEELAESLGLKANTVKNLINQGKIPCSLKDGYVTVYAGNLYKYHFMES